MATVAFIVCSALFVLGMAVFMTVFLLIVHAVSALARHALRRRRREKDREFYDHYLDSGNLYD